ncbi:hypothetical protein A2962_05430 [Candidatus Woesebacteria bacterium RIFCSPLOWO2_01_FULL_39_61]|uniref:Uncharacterized protein n=1 Tax=Candidatus Woesebacteria bacterium RIFCSPHIGHO2_02_FULL_39_13 TaxID=1802505 RepID=A0A1F7Z6A2_9BACT|nr:MAG: hypothetical protein A2692_00745 [Candidatus Woesebacteria bacterium RIFCSPHIGHO2_01_FULL_39_95]OGM34649.1 MAG: hypothetical protein A3D01_06435 [Candidatus Woesebacteria bacterium RIFCSPHIGHO2_02_FULL_39_13]OGM37391.1 MAG: hypothetical protein A3E13_05465 [Candidatus Woesebacteria bacterium RIFCSPHIGHO2_12_FULL_40_20]OGM68357.1 MAG: hypothetical protein A2962_05430 [Candidatus Woesebacteria bacterium RIFCSPLOWO2_01_FULL_39_61]OGM71889.1 MAG: hypothetical protein A3H19_05430 [Candidatus
MINEKDLMEKMVSQIIKRYSDIYNSEFLFDKLRNLHPDLLGVLSIFLEAGHLDTYEVEGFTPQRLMDEHGMNTTAAIFTLDWLLREPERAKESLTRGHDSLNSSLG